MFRGSCGVIGIGGVVGVSVSVAGVGVAGIGVSVAGALVAAIFINAFTAGATEKLQQLP